MVGSGGLQRRHQRLSLYQLLARLAPTLTLLACWLAGLLGRDGLLIGIILLLSPHIDLILLRSGKHIIQFTIVLHSRDPVLGQPIDSLLLLGCRDRYDLKTRLRKQKFLPGCG